MKPFYASIRKLLLLLALLILLLTALPAAADLAVRYQPVRTVRVQKDDLPTEVDWVHVKVDERIFTLFAALNMAGYDAEYFGEDYHPARQLIHERLAGKTFSGQSRLRQELKFLDSYNFVVWALHYGGPPDFFRQEQIWTPSGMPAFLFFGLDEVLRDFYQEMDIASLWQEVKPLYELEATRYQVAAGSAVRDTMSYIRMDEAPVQQVVVIPNLVDEHWSGFGPQVGDTAYIVVGPTGDQPDVGLIQHEALHSLIGPLVESNLNAVDPHQARALFAALKTRVPQSYGSWEIIVEESVIRALNSRLVRPEWQEISLNNAEKAGLLLVRPLAEKLKAYEASDMTLAEYMPELLGTLNEINPEMFHSNSVPLSIRFGGSR